MTKQEFVSGKPFRVASSTGYQNYKGSSTFFYDGSCMMRQTRSSVDERILYSDYHMNIKTIGDKWFSGFTYVMNKKVQIRLKFEQLVEFVDQGPQYDGAGFSIKDREQDPELQSHHCDDPSCNCSI